ncbi:MAG TPA: RND transporter, partial [Methylophaga aminisulfidivorans]|nr:RND transporter [Methylophaga aminisulfidivorans]
AISLPIFDAGRIRAQLKQRDAEYDVAVSQYKSTLSGAIQDISDSLSAIHTAQQQLNSTDVAMKASEANVAHAMDAYDVGLTDYLPIVDAKLAAFQQRLLKTDIQAEVLAASVALNIALGGGLVGNEQSPKVEQIATRSMP